MAMLNNQRVPISKTWPRNLFAGISPGNFEIFNCCPRNSSTLLAVILRVDESWLEIPLTDPMKYNSTTNYHDNNDEQNY